VARDLDRSREPGDEPGSREAVSTSAAHAATPTTSAGSWR
jgi:hypothetical protein